MTETTLPKTYDFKATEQQLYRWWEANGWFKPGNDPRDGAPRRRNVRGLRRGRGEEQD